MKSNPVINQVDQQGQKTGVWEEFFLDGLISSVGDYLEGQKQESGGIFSEMGCLRL
jgi:hypothetical protein